MKTQILILIILGFIFAVIISFTHVQLHFAVKKSISNKPKPIDKNSEIEDLRQEIQSLKSRIEKLENEGTEKF